MVMTMYESWCCSKCKQACNNDHIEVGVPRSMTSVAPSITGKGFKFCKKCADEFVQYIMRSCDITTLAEEFIHPG